MDADVTPVPEELIRCVGDFRKQPRGHAELELRLGSYADGRFSAGVPRDVFDQLLADLIDTPELVAQEGWTEMIDYHYTTSRNERVRSRVTFDSQRIDMAKEHVAKHSKGNVIFRRAEDTDGSNHEACRVAWALELPLHNPPSVCVPTHVRIKQRRVFQDVRDGAIVWSYELSKTWSANSRSAVEQLQHLSPPVYEVECELVDANGTYLKTHDDEEVAESLLLKSKVLMGEEQHANVDIVSQHAPCDARPGRKRSRSALAATAAASSE